MNFILMKKTTENMFLYEKCTASDDHFVRKPRSITSGSSFEIWDSISRNKIHVKQKGDAIDYVGGFFWEGGSLYLILFCQKVLSSVVETRVLYCSNLVHCDFPINMKQYTFVTKISTF